MTSQGSAGASDASPYRGRTVAVGTRHGKQHQFAPSFHAILGARLQTPPDLDTDSVGTFTGEIARTMTAVEAARAKARLAMAATGLPYGLASEASYGPLTGGWSGHEELLLFCDERLGIEVLEGHRTLSVPGPAHRVSDSRQLPPAVLDSLPGQALVVRPSAGTGAIAKGITAADTLPRAIAAAVAASADGLAVVEPDLRAHHNPSRRIILARLATSLAHRLATGCPACGTPGFGRVDAEPGLRCRVCDTPTDRVGAEIHGCPSCEHRAIRPVGGHAEPSDCPACNP